MRIYLKCSQDIESTDYSKFNTVFMLMQRHKGGMYFLGKFYADNMWNAKEELQQAIKRHPDLADAGLYVSKYNSYFDTDENRNDPDGVEKDVFDCVDDLVEELDSSENYDII